MASVRLNDIGTIIILTLREGGAIVDISSATSKFIQIRKPSGDIANRTGNFLTNGTDGKLYCVVLDGDLDELGVYRAAMHLTLGNWTGNSTSLRFTVENTP